MQKTEEIISEIKKHIPSPLIKLARIFQKHDSKLYIVGGFIRDKILGIEKKEVDIDLASNLTPDEIQKILVGTKFKAILVNKKIGTLHIFYENNAYFEHTTFRVDNYSMGYHLPSSVRFVNDLETDAKRRDFTINSIYFDILGEKIIDLYGGLKDLDNKIIKCIETPKDVFSSDGLRILRLIRFWCQLPDFKIDTTALESAKEHANLLSYISKERVANEIKKCFYNLDNNINKNLDIILFIKTLINLNLFPIIFSKTDLDFSKIIERSIDWEKYVNKDFKIKAVEAFCIITCFILDTPLQDVQSTCYHILGFKGLQIEKKQAQELSISISAYFELINALSEMDNYIKFIQKYFDKLSIIYNYLGFLTKHKTIEQQEKIKYDLEGAILFMKLNDIPFTKKDLPISGWDIKKCFPNIETKRISELINWCFEYATKHYTLDKMRILFALERKEKKDYGHTKPIFDID